MMTRRLNKTERRLIMPALLETQVAPEAECRRALEACRLIRRIPSVLEVRDVKAAVAYAALRSRASGITLGDDVYVRSEFFDARGDIPIRLVAHEVAHVVQFRRDGTLPFLMRYVWDYSSGLARGLTDRDAYLAIGYEIEARRVAEEVAPARN